MNGTVLDPTGAVVPNATVEIHNPVSHFERSTTTDKSGNFSIPNVPFNPYHMTVTATGFAQSMQDVEIRSVIPTTIKVSLQVSGSLTSVTVEAPRLICWKTIQLGTPTWIAIYSPKCHSKASPPR